LRAAGYSMRIPDACQEKDLLGLIKPPA